MQGGEIFVVDEILEFAFSHVDLVRKMPKAILSIEDNLVCIQNPCCLPTKNVCSVVAGSSSNFVHRVRQWSCWHVEATGRAIFFPASSRTKQYTNKLN